MIDKIIFQKIFINMETLKTPISIKIISIVVITVYSVMCFFRIIKAEQHYLLRLDISAKLFFILNILIILFIFILLGIKLWKGKNYARIIIIVLSLLYPFLLPSFSFSSVVHSFLKSPAILFYLIAAILLFSRNIKIFFNSKGKMTTKKVIFLVIIIALPILTFFPIYDGYRICGSNPFGGCWNTDANLIEYIQYINR